MYHTHRRPHAWRNLATTNSQVITHRKWVMPT
jgi:hypothetical protein